VNSSGEAFLPLRLRRLLSPLKRAVAPLRGSIAFEAVRTTLARPIDYPVMNEELRQRLTDYYATDVADLQKFLGRDLNHWIELPSRVAA
jgi:hypothetical protein